MPTCPSPDKDWTPRPGEASLPGTTPRVCSPPLPKGVCALHGERVAGALHLELSWTLPCESLPLADFNLHPLMIINHSCEYNSVQGLLSLLSKLSNLWVVSGSPGLYSWRRKRSQGALPSSRRSASEAVARVFLGGPCPLLCAPGDVAGSGFRVHPQQDCFLWTSCVCWLVLPHRVVLHLFLPDTQGFQWL